LNAQSFTQSFRKLKFCVKFEVFDMIGERIRELRGKETQVQWEVRFGVTRDTIRRYERGTNPPDADFIAILCEAYNINAHWLITGKGTKDLNSQQIAPEKQDGGATPMPSDKLGLGESVELLAKIYNSGNKVLIRAIAANLHAFSEAVDNKALAQRAIDMMDEMNKRVLALEKDLAILKEENEELKKREPENDQHQATG